MEQKIYFFSKISRRENTKNTLESKRTRPTGLLFPKMKKVYAPNLIISNSPTTQFRPYSLSPLQQFRPNPKSISYKLVNEKAKLSSRSTSRPSHKVNIRYLVQDYEDVEILNTIKTPDDSLKNSKLALAPDLKIPDFEVLFSQAKKTQQTQSSRPDSPLFKR